MLHCKIKDTIYLLLLILNIKLFSNDFLNNLVFVINATNRKLYFYFCDLNYYFIYIFLYIFGNAGKFGKFGKTN